MQRFIMGAILGIVFAVVVLLLALPKSGRLELVDHVRDVWYFGFWDDRSYGHHSLHLYGHYFPLYSPHITANFDIFHLGLNPETGRFPDPAVGDILPGQTISLTHLQTVFTVREEMLQSACLSHKWGDGFFSRGIRSYAVTLTAEARTEMLAALSPHLKGKVHTGPFVVTDNSRVWLYAYGSEEGFFGSEGAANVFRYKNPYDFIIDIADPSLRSERSAFAYMLKNSEKECDRSIH